ncbi:MAG TPA: S8 family serine peptidase [Actinoplanes sp.]|nr:S8 family serine peptidase [Actinoplanes sp.]
MSDSGDSPALPPIVYAQASPRSVGGVSLFDVAQPVDAGSVLDFMSEQPVINEAEDRLRTAGFDVLQVSPTTINIAGPPALYEEYFGVTLEAQERPAVKSGGRAETATYVECLETDLPGLVPVDRSPAAEVLEGVALEEPVYFHESAFPVKPGYWHLSPPGDIAAAVNAERAHRGRTTGLGIKAVMVDSGWYRHPYFVQRGYRVAPVVLGPAAARPDDDEVGHGTGESANLLAVAPDADFGMVKINFVNSIGAFNVAAQMSPHIISCSWGSNVTGATLSAAQQALSAAIATAVSAGIVVVFSAGNGVGLGFPGQHPDVISAGGVMIEADGSLHASNYTMGGVSRAFAGRTVPDVSGLVGMRPTAMLIVLPVQPGDELDANRAGGVFPTGDQTGPQDGWGVFSGTSAAAPQIAGVCALLKQAHGALTPAEVKDILGATAIDVTTGVNANGNPAGPGYDLATGHGLVDAHRAVLIADLRRQAADQDTPIANPFDEPVLSGDLTADL